MTFSAWRTDVERMARQILRLFTREFPGGLQEPSSYAVSAVHRSGVNVGRGSRAGLTGWYSGGENEGQ